MFSYVPYSAYEKGGQWALALDVFWEMRGVGAQMDVVTFSSLIKACAAGKQVRSSPDKACESLLATSDLSENSRQCNSVHSVLQNCLSNRYVLSAVVGDTSNSHPSIQPPEFGSGLRPVVPTIATAS